jgi:signal transduction histidine kinase/ActR/RegA family two-component response regulator
MESYRDVLETEQIRSTYANLPVTLSVSVLNSVLLGFVLTPIVPQTKIFVWIGLVIGLSALRLASLYFYRNRGREDARSRRWGRLATAGALASGAIWGCGVLLFSPLDDPHRLFVALVIGGMCAGAATVHAAHFPSVLAFILPSILPLSANLFIGGDRLQIVSGVMVCVCGLAMCIASLRFRRWFRETTLARLVLARRTTQIHASNARLKVEVINHQATEAMLRHAQRQAEHQLAEAGKTQVIGQLAGGIAHDFNNVLGIILGNLELMQSCLGDKTAAGELCRDAMSGVSHGAELTRQLLAFARRQPLNPRSTDVNESVRSTSRMFERLLTERIGLHLDLDPTVGPALIDPTQLEAALINLLSNARDAMKSGGKLTIATRRWRVDRDGTDTDHELDSGDYVLVEVEDTGVGISESIIDKIFDPFFTTKENGKGSGLGLSVVFGFIKQSGGHVSVRSDPGRATVFSLYLPCSLQGGEALPEKNASPPSLDPVGGLETVLVVDDNIQLRRATVRQLVQLGYRVLEASDAITARAILEADSTVSLLCSDVAMPGDMDGIALVQWAAARRPRLRSILTSGFSNSEGRQQHLTALGCRFLEKPFRRHELALAIREALDQVGDSTLQI